MKLTCTLFTTAFILTVLNQAGMWQTSAFVLGVAHPLLGMDHILVMMAVGLWAVLVGGRALWVFPLTFLSTMLGGFAAASFGFGLPFVEPAIALSIIVIGLLVALAVKVPVWFGSVITALIAFFHGHAHGTEAAVASLVSYAIGFTLATATLHAIGIALGICVVGSIRQVAIRAMGGITALIGLALMVI